MAKTFLDTISHGPPHSSWWNFAQTCISTTSRTLLNFKVIGQRWRSRGFFGGFLCAWCYGYPRTVLSLEQGLMILFRSCFRHWSVYVCLSCLSCLTAFFRRSWLLNALIERRVRLEEFVRFNKIILALTVRRFIGRITGRSRPSVCLSGLLTQN